MVYDLVHITTIEIGGGGGGGRSSSSNSNSRRSFFSKLGGFLVEKFWFLVVFFSNALTYSVACANGMPMKDGLSVSVYISMPVPRR